MPNLHHESYWFDEFNLDLRRGCLQHGQQEIRLRRKSFEVLKYLVENSGRLVSKHELIDAVWVDTVVTDDSLVQCLKDIRHALRDYSQRIIKTVHSRGYIFNVEVRDLSTAHKATQPEEITLVQTDVAMIRKGDVEAANTFEHLSLGSTDNLAIDATARRPLTRLVVLPFRMLRADSNTEFLAFSVPDAVAGALSVLDSVVVRSPIATARYAHETLDLMRIAKETQSEVVLTGTILRAGNEIRVTCQLLDARNGAVLWWHEPRVSMSGLFELQDKLVLGIVDSLALSLSAREHRRLDRDVPNTPLAYEFFLRGNELSQRGLAGFADLAVARDLYRRSVELDPGFAPAWAQLGRCYRLIGKGMENGHKNLRLAESAFKRALKLNHDLVLAHSQYALLEAELGRAKDAIARLLQCAQSGSPSPTLFAALVLCCRFCGLLDASVGAHDRARKLDPQIATSVSHTYYQLGEYGNALRTVALGAWAIEGMVLGTVGSTPNALAAFRKLDQSGTPAPMRAFVCAWRAMFEGNRDESLSAAGRCITHYLDPEGVFYMGLIMSHLGEFERALNALSESIDRGFTSPNVLRSNPWFDGLRSTVRFNDLLERAEAGLIEAHNAYCSMGGPQVLFGGLGAKAS